MGLFKDYVSQTRKPEGRLGEVMISGMNSGHAQMADWGLSHLPEITPEKAVDLGCGGGRNAGELMECYPEAQVTAIDYSPLSVAKAREYNAAKIETGRCEVKEGNVSALEMENESYDLATAFETIYFWPGLEKCFAEVCRVLRPGGQFLIVNESDGYDKSSKTFEKIIDGMTAYTIDQIKAALKAAGFASVKTAHHKKSPWICILAQKGGSKDCSTPAIVQIRSMKPAELNDVSAQIGESFWHYQYDEGEGGLKALIPSRRAMDDYMKALVVAGMESGIFYGLENGAGYIMISGAGKHPGLRSVLKMTNSIQRSLGGWKKMYDFFMAANGGDKTLEQKMKEAERPFVKVEMLLVTKDYQKQGYMRRLLEFAYKVAKENSCACILDTDARSKCDRYMHLGMELENTRQQAGFKIYDLIKE